MDRISQARSDTMRGIARYDIGGGEHVELPNNYQHAWRGENGQYIVSNDPLYNPNTDPNSGTNWTQLQQAR
jgi:hypothetical protein